MTKEAIQTFSYRISQASRSELVVILYDMACGYLDDAKQILELNDEIRGEDSAVIDYIDALRKCGRVIDLLIKGLDFQYEISNNLFHIYLYIKQELVKCTAHRKSEQLQHIKGLLCQLRASFYEVSKTDKSGPLMKNTQQVFSGLTYSAFGSSNEIAGNVNSNRGFTV